MSDMALEMALKEIAALKKRVASLERMEPATIASLTAAGFGGRLPFCQKQGLVISNNGSDANNDIDVAVGKMRDSSDTVDLELSSALTKRLDASFVAGTNQGGLFSGSKANSTWYHVFLIRKDSDRSMDVGFDTSVTAANKPAGYTYRRRIGAVRTNSSGNILGFYEYAGRFMWIAASTDLSGGTQTSPTAFTVLTPLGVKTKVIGAAQVDGNGKTLNIYDPDYAPTGVFTLYATASSVLSGYMEAFSNSSSQLRYVVSSGGTVYWYTYGWQELWQI
jgi:hypothetical protein